MSEASAEYLPRAAPSLRVRFTQADKPVVRQLNRTDEEAVMRRIFVLALAALALLGVVTPDAFAQAPTPKFKINGLIDQVTSYSAQHQQLRRQPATSTTAVVRPDPRPLRLHRRSRQGQGRGRYRARPGLRPDRIGNDSTIVKPVRLASSRCRRFGTDGSFDLNTDVRGHLRDQVALHRVRGAADPGADGGPARRPALRRGGQLQARRVRQR